MSMREFYRSEGESSYLVKRAEERKEKAKETPNKSATGSRLATESIFSPVFGDRLHQKPGF